MGIPLINVQPRPSAGSQIVGGLASGLETLLEEHRKKKQSSALADFYGISEEKRADWNKLSPEIQKLVGTSYQKKELQKEKDLAGATKYVEGELKRLGSTYLNEKDFGNIQREYKDLIKKGHTKDNAFELAFGKIKAPKEKEEGEKGGAGALSDLFGLAGPALQSLTKETGEKHPSGAIPLSEKGLGQRAKETGAALPLGLTQAAENFSAISPLLNLAQQKSNFPGIEELLQNKTPLKREKYFDKPSEILKNKLFEQYGPKEGQEIAETADVLSVVAGLVGPKVYQKIKNLLPKGAIAPDEILAAEKGITVQAPKQIAQAPSAGEPVSPKQPTPKPKASPEKSPLAGRVSEAPATATESRVARTEPEARIYPRLKNIELRETQLKKHPKYVREIEVDQLAREERAAKRVPKTEADQLSLENRKTVASSKLPAVQESYTRSIARVRALENEVAKLTGEAKESAETLLEMAQKDLDNAQFELRQTMNNARSGESRVGIPEMQRAARKKMIDIGDKISEGQEVKLSKADYSPDLIKQAEDLQKRKSIPSSKPDDFYNVVHDTYVDEYKGRIAKIDKEMKSLPRTGSGIVQHHQLQKEKDILNMMIDSAKAETAIHRHKLGLREMAERQKADQHFRQLKKAEGKAEVGRVAQEKMWKSRISEVMKDADSIPEIAEEAIESAVAENPKMADQIRKEKTKLEEALGDVHKFTKERAAKAAGAPKQGAKPPPAPPKPSPEALPSAKDYVKKANNRFKQFRDLVDKALSKIPILGETEEGKGIAAGIITGIWDEIRHEFDVTVTSGQVAGILLGRKGFTTRYSANQATRWLIQQGKKAVARYAAETHNEELFGRFSPKIRKEVLKSS